MTSVRFFENGDNIIGFSISGHSSANCSDFEGKLVCAAVSSAAYMAANTLIEVVGAKVNPKISDAFMEVIIKSRFKESQTVLKGFKLHIAQLKEQYTNNIQVITEV